ncbi:MAG: 3-phosphoshikimate 1-carboxyvinyltransferase [Syntrophomonas sp.]
MERVSECERPLKGELFAAPDKSISHRSIIFSGLGKGKGAVNNFLRAGDTMSTCGCMRSLGIEVIDRGGTMVVEGKGLHGLSEPVGILDCGNSGTTMRLLSGLLAGQGFLSLMSGDYSLNRRPMRRVIEPLTAMGAEIWGRAGGFYPPLAIKGSENLKGITYHMPVASAQVKSALLLAGLYAGGPTRIIEPEKSRDHTERMLQAMGADIEVQGLEITLKPGKELTPQEFFVPVDISSAAFFLVAALIVPGSEIIIRDVGINPNRSGLIEVLQAMGARITIDNQRVIGGEPIGDIVAGYSELHGTMVGGEIIPRLIDEVPILAVAMALADGESMVKDAGELRVKESDRIKAICSELGKMGAGIEELEDGFVIQGRPEGLKGAAVDSRGDHRIAMSTAIAALKAGGETIVNNSEVVDISFPEFWPLLRKLMKA